MPGVILVVDHRPRRRVVNDALDVVRPAMQAVYSRLRRAVLRSLQLATAAMYLFHFVVVLLVMPRALKPSALKATLQFRPSSLSRPQNCSPLKPNTRTRMIRACGISGYLSLDDDDLSAIDARQMHQRRSGRVQTRDEQRLNFFARFLHIVKTTIG
jgi:hypothetical protein